MAQPSGVLLATKARDDTPWSPAAWRAGDTGQPQAERGVRFRQDPQFLASALDLKTPERIMALLMVMTVCLCVYAALESRLRTALKDHDPTFPNQPGQPVHNPTARWVVHDGVGSHRLVSPGPWPQVVHLTEAHQHRLQLLGKPDVRVYA